MSHSEFKEASLCRVNGKTCGACCWGVSVSQSELEVLLERHRTSFRFWTRGGTALSPLRLFLHETWCRRGQNIVWAVALRLPSVGQRLKQSLGQNLTCAFMGFDTSDQSAVGCMMHPARFGGRDVRQGAAFRFLPGVECGDPGYVCDGCSRVDALDETTRAAVVEAISSGDWYKYTQTIRLMSAGLIALPESLQRSAKEKAGALLPILPD